MILRREFYINGAWVAPATPRDCAVINPSDEEPVAIISLGDQADTDAAVAAAKAAFPGWAATPPAERRAAVVRILEQYEARKEELARAITITWVGPPEQILRKLADRASYNFVTLGNRPPVPLVVNVDVQNMPVIEVLRDIGLQLGVRGDVKVDSERGIIELHYAPVTGVGG